MGAIQLQTAAFPRALQREAESLSREKDVEIQADALRSFAGRLERRHPELSIQIYGLLTDAPTTPPEQRKVAQERLDALQGRGTGGARWEAMIGRFLPEATDYRMIVPMMVATSVTGLVRAAALGRLAGSSGSWFSGRLGARIGAGGLAFAAEVPAFTLSGRALHAMGGRSSESPLSQDLAATALTLGCLKGFVGLGAKISPNPALHAAVFAPAGLYTAHGLEERMGWRPASDSTSRAVDAIAASLSLGIGARLGREVLGEGWNRRFSEMALRAETVRPRPLAWPELKAPWLPEPMLMSAESGGAKPPAAPEIPRAAESSGSTSNREFKRSREIFRFSLMGDPVRNIEARLESSTQPLRILDLNPGDGIAAGELRRRFGDRVTVETVKDHLESGDFLQADFGGQRYDMILALLGAPAAEGQFLPFLQKAVDHLQPGGEFTGAFSVAGFKAADVSTWREMETLPKIRAGLQRGLAL
ncbi:MAG TPA: class I SAM-dependent methyltransferase, partial [bacterium]|nr:class I SAM-dependent methyltransferase [bacterium]